MPKSSADIDETALNLPSTVTRLSRPSPSFPCVTASPLSLEARAPQSSSCPALCRHPRLCCAPFRCFHICCDLFQSKANRQSELANARGTSLDRIFDLAIIGGGINGCGIARDAAAGAILFSCADE